MKVVVTGGPAVTINGDADELDQLLINLIANAVEARSDTGGGASVSWSAALAATG